MKLTHHPVSLVARARGDERGAALVLVALCLSVLVTAVAFTVDLGRVSTSRRNLQKTADVVALDLARRLDGRTTAQIVAAGDLDAAQAASLDRNGFRPAGERRADRAIGHWDAASETFTPTTGAEVPDAVQVVLTDRVDFELAPGGATTSRRAVAANRARASFRIGSYAARVDSSTSPLLQPLLGSILGASAVGYEGLVGGQVELGPFLGNLGLSLGSPSEVLVTSVTLAQVLRAEADVLRLGGDVARADLLDQVVLHLRDPGAPIALADLFALGVGTDEGAAAIQLDAFDLLTSSAFVANGSAFLDVPATSTGIGSLATTRAQVRVLAPPAVVVDGTVGDSARTAQVTVRLTVAGDVPGLAHLTADLTLESASAVGTIAAIGCRAPQSLDIDVRTGLLTAAAPVSATLYATDPQAGGVPLAAVELRAATSEPATAHTVAFDLPPDRFGVPATVTTAGIGLGGATVTVGTTTLLGPLPLGYALDATIAGTITGVVTPLLAALDATVATPLLRALGATVAGADVTPLDVRCHGTSLVG
ncbi:MAG: putative transrane protein [Acidimicrobiales bacterium]|nr:putative transrane protein [Acidimicrobiales bacterium]